MHHLSTSKEHGKLHPVPFFEEFDCVFDLDTTVMVVDLWTQPNLFECYSVLSFLVLFLFALLLIEPLTEVHDTAYGRLGVWGDLDQIKPGLPCLAQGIVGIDDADLVVLFVDQSDRTYADPVVDSESLFADCLYLSFLNTRSIQLHSTTLRTLLSLVISH